MEHGRRMTYVAGLPCFFGLGLEDGDVPTFCLLLSVVPRQKELQSDRQICRSRDTLQDEPGEEHPLKRL